jgi:prepilin-type N-terminal cleavage/methylation domain-containing protein
MSKGFTLIEILVVIVVIGIISSFIVVGLSSVSDKANIAKGQAFINSIDNSLLLGRVSHWKMDESSGNTIYDSWGTNNGTKMDTTGACDTSHCPQTKTNGCISNNCLLFDGSNDWVNVGSFDQYSNGFSFLLWFKSNFINSRQDLFWAESDKFILSLQSSYSLSHYARSLNGNTGYINSSLKFNTNNWFFVALTYSPNLGKTSLYINGVKDSQQGNITGPSVSAAYLRLGTQYNYAGDWFNGYIDDVKIYSESMATSKIQQNYFLGLDKLYKNKEITKSEYIKRITELKSNLANN